MKEWGSLLVKKHLFWTDFDVTEAEEERQLIADDRQHCLKKVYRQEDRNREAVEKLLEAENSRRYDRAKCPKAEVPRVSIEFSVSQMDKLGPEVLMISIRADHGEPLAFQFLLVSPISWSSKYGGACRKRTFVRLSSPIGSWKVFRPG